MIAGALLLLLVSGGIRPEHGAAVALLLLATLGLVRGFWPAWAFLTVLGVAGFGHGLVHAIGAGPKWWSAVVLNAAMMILLLAPSTRRHMQRRRPRAAGWP